MPPHFHFFCPYSFCWFLVCYPLLFVPSHCLRKTVCRISCSLILPHLLSYLVLGADCCIKVSPFLLPVFFPLVYWHVLCFQHPKTNSPSPLFIQLVLGSMGFDPWLSGQAGGLDVQSFLILSNFSACPGAVLKIGCQSTVKKSASKKSVQRVVVLLWQIVQYELASPLLWTWTWRTQQRSGHGWHLGCWMLSVWMWVDCCRLWSVICGRVPKFGSGFSLSGELFWDLIILKVLSFWIFNSSWFLPETVVHFETGGKKF